MPDALHRSDEIKDQSTVNSVTGLVNSQEFERRVMRVLQTFSEENNAVVNEEHALFRIDLEQFALVNEYYGPLAGEALLRQFTCLLQQVVRVRDTLAHLRVNEFGVLMEHCSLNHAHRVANKIIQEVQCLQFFYNDHCFNINVSIGIVSI
ncbi:MAG: diguanylate cyclase, partial [Nitrosomonas sp.]|nr:diguanylate cyclase [Nitrosomonas sp.]